jgi:1,4-alpha-glucan branching enzyme
VVEDEAQSVFAFVRYGLRLEDTVVVIANFTPVVRQHYRVGLPHDGAWTECLNTDSGHYGGGNVGNHGRVQAEALPLHGQGWSAALTLPPLGVLWLQKE